MAGIGRAATCPGTIDNTSAGQAAKILNVSLIMAVAGVLCAISFVAVAGTLYAKRMTRTNRRSMDF